MNFTIEIMTSTSDYWTATATAACVRYQFETNRLECDDDWEEHRFGLCRMCNCGLDDESEFVDIGDDSNTILVCFDCWGGSAPQRRGACDE